MSKLTFIFCFIPKFYLNFQWTLAMHGISSLYAWNGHVCLFTVDGHVFSWCGAPWKYQMILDSTFDPALADTHAASSAVINHGATFRVSTYEGFLLFSNARQAIASSSIQIYGKIPARASAKIMYLFPAHIPLPLNIWVLSQEVCTYNYF